MVNRRTVVAPTLSCVSQPNGGLRAAVYFMASVQAVSLFDVLASVLVGIEWPEYV
jgi:hypothetical protein